MNIALISFTAQGAELGAKLGSQLEAFEEFRGFVSARFAGDPPLPRWEGSLSDWTQHWFCKADALIFVGACGIAVRAIAPFVRDKFADPAVLVIDEKGKFCISLLSGHVGGANALCSRCAAYLDSTPVITTATDLNGKFAVDVFARQNDLYLTDRRLAKEISAAVLAGKPIGFTSELPVEGKLPPELRNSSDCEFAISVGFQRPESDHTLWLVPRTLVLGIGCRKQTAEESIEAFALDELSKLGLPVQAVNTVASIDLKAQEQGLLQFCKKYGFAFRTYSAAELMQAQGTFAPSKFVRGVTGVDNVCQRSAVYDAQTHYEEHHLLLEKQKGNGVTLSLAAGVRTIRFPAI